MQLDAGAMSSSRPSPWVFRLSQQCRSVCHATAKPAAKVQVQRYVCAHARARAGGRPPCALASVTHLLTASRHRAELGAPVLHSAYHNVPACRCAAPLRQVDQQRCHRERPSCSTSRAPGASTLFGMCAPPQSRGTLQTSLPRITARARAPSCWHAAGII
jgi:hypothetical protein